MAFARNDICSNDICSDENLQGMTLAQMAFARMTFAQNDILREGKPSGESVSRGIQERVSKVVFREDLKGRP